MKVMKEFLKRLKNKYNQKKGFTLIEILAVVTIIGLIFILVIPRIINSLRNKKGDIDKTTTNIVLSSAKIYVEDHLSKFEKVDGNVSCMPIEQLVKKNYLEGPVKNVTDDVDITNIKSVKITYNKGFEYEIVNRKDCVAHETKVVRYFADILVNKANSSLVTSYNRGNSHQMYTFSHAATEQTTVLTDYRYIGSTPYNYVEFNGELWRIVGVFTVENSEGNLEQRVKITRNELLSDKKSWNSSDTNEWTTASLNTYFNGDYYNSIEASNKTMINDAKYYLAACRTDAGDGSAYYSCERSNTGFSNRSKNWVGKIALLYPSDYVYTFANGIDSPCYTDAEDCSTRGGDPTKSWIFNMSNGNSQWLITPRYTSLTGPLALNGSGDISGISSAILKKSVNPVIYLSYNVTYKSGSGKLNKPYKISIAE